MDWLRTVLARYATLQGRARRREFWRFLLHSMVIYAVLMLVDALTGTFSFELQFGLLSGLWMLFITTPSGAVAVRRLHDTNRSGWWLLLGLIPFLGQLILLYFWIQEGDTGDNRYGPDPKTNSLV
jgi:uncharacterized membrane protein YhaH (DUF805 family)